MLTRASFGIIRDKRDRKSAIPEREGEKEKRRRRRNIIKLCDGFTSCRDRRRPPPIDLIA